MLFLFTQDDDELLLNLVISEIQSDPDPGKMLLEESIISFSIVELSGALNLMNYLKLLIDPENMMAASISEETEFLSFFYFLCFSLPTSGTSRFHENHFLSLQRLRKDERDLDADAENWFNDDTEENRITSLNHGTLFNNNSDDDDSQPEITSAISSSEPTRSRHSSSDNDEEDEDGLPTSSRSAYTKPVISIQIGRSREGGASLPTSSPYAMVMIN